MSTINLNGTEVNILLSLLWRKEEDAEIIQKNFKKEIEILKNKLIKCEH